MKINDKPHLIATNDGTLVSFEDNNKVVIKNDNEYAETNSDDFWNYIYDKLKSTFNYFSKKDIKNFK